MVKFTAVMKQYETHADKTGWTYIEVPAELAQAIKPDNKKEFKVKGLLDRYVLKQVAVLPVGGGDFIIPVNGTMRKAIGKRKGAIVQLQLLEDKSAFIFNSDFLECLADDPAADHFFKTLPGSHQRYFSKWIDSAKTEATRTKRIAQAVSGLAAKMDYGSMIRFNQQKK